MHLNFEAWFYYRIGAPSLLGSAAARSFGSCKMGDRAEAPGSSGPGALYVFWFVQASLNPTPTLARGCSISVLVTG